MTLSVEQANKQLDALRSEHLSVQVHVGPPGDGRSNRAREVRRQRIRFRAPIDARMRTTVPPVWQAVPADETWTHFSLWDMDRAPVAFGALDEPRPVRKGDSVQLDVTVRVNVATSSTP